MEASGIVIRCFQFSQWSPLLVGHEDLAHECGGAVIAGSIITTGG